MARILSASSFRSLLHCPHALFLDHHGNPTLKTELGEFEQYLLEDGQQFEHEVIAQKTYIRPEYPVGDLDAGADATLQLMRLQTPLIYQGVLKSDRFVGIPDLLVLKPGASKLGDWHYAPQEIKTSRSVQPFHKLQVCLYAMLLELVQGHRPEKGTVILANGSENDVDVSTEWSEFERRLAEAIAIVDCGKPTDLAIFSGCKECAWHDACINQARTRKDITLVADLQRRTKPALAELGILTVDDLANADPEQLKDIRWIGGKSAERLPLQAKCQMTGTTVSLVPPQLPESPVELYYDIESEPSLDLDYLHGLLVVEPRSEPRYVAFLAEQPNEEGEAFGRFVRAISDVLERHPLAPIYHYHSYERTRVRRLFATYPNQPINEKDLLGRFVDLHKVLTGSFVLPVEGYGLKPVAKWLGFKYRNPKSSATQSMLWYRLWLETGERQYLDDSVLYNEDDCLATRLTKNWIASGTEQ